MSRSQPTAKIRPAPSLGRSWTIRLRLRSGGLGGGRQRRGARAGGVRSPRRP